MSELRSRHEIFSDLCESYLSEDSLRRAAYIEWERDGCPDGDAICPQFGVPHRNMHWLRAKLIMEALADTDSHFLYACQYCDSFLQ